MDKDFREQIINGWIRNTYETSNNEDLEPVAELVWTINAILDVTWSDPQSAWFLILDIIETDSSELILSHVGAGPLETFLWYYADSFIENVEAEARTNEPFRMALRDVWKGDISDKNWQRICAAAGDPSAPSRK